MSWTLSREKAEWFALRSPRDGEPVVYTATVEAEHALGYFIGRGESEVVVEPETLGAPRDVRTVEIEQADKSRWSGSRTVRIFPNPKPRAVHDDDLGLAGCLRAADGRSDLLGVEPPRLLEHRLAAVRLPALHDPGDAPRGR